MQRIWVGAIVALLILIVVCFVFSIQSQLQISKANRIEKEKQDIEMNKKFCLFGMDTLNFLDPNIIWIGETYISNNKSLTSEERVWMINEVHARSKKTKNDFEENLNQKFKQKLHLLGLDTLDYLDSKSFSFGDNCICSDKSLTFEEQWKFRSKWKDYFEHAKDSINYKLNQKFNLLDLSKLNLVDPGGFMEAKSRILEDKSLTIGEREIMFEKLSNKKVHQYFYSFDFHKTGVFIYLETYRKIIFNDERLNEEEKRSVYYHVDQYYKKLRNINE